MKKMIVAIVLYVLLFIMFPMQAKMDGGNHLNLNATEYCLSECVDGAKEDCDKVEDIALCYESCMKQAQLE